MRFTKRINRLFCLALFITTSPCSFSSTPNTFFPAPFNSSWVVTLSGGPAWGSGANTQTLWLAPEIQKTYTMDNSSEAFANGDLFLGIQKSLNEKFQGQIGLDFAAAGNAKFSGDIWDDADPNFNNYTYNYKVSHTHIALKGKLLADMGWALIPWISASAGVGENRAHDFNNAPALYQAVSMPNFTSETTTAFTYTLGIGVQRVLTPNWQLGISYEFADWGKSQLGSASGQTIGSGLSLSHLYTSSALLNLTYIA